MEEEDNPKIEASRFDRPYGWIVVLASFTCCVIVDGITFSMGIFLPHLEAEFKTPKQSLAWLGSLLAGVYLFSGPFVGVLVSKYGANRVTLVGSIVGSAAFVASSFSPQFTMLMSVAGILGGIGFGLVFLPAIVTVGQYFKKRLAMATGIAVCGSGMGQIIVPIIANQILEVYSWRTSFQAMGAGILICGLAGLAFRPNKPQRINLLQRMKKERDEQRRWNSDLEINEISMSKIKQPLPGIEEEDLSIISTEETPKQINDIPNGSLETNEIMKSESSLIDGVKISTTEYPLIDKPPVEVVVESQNVVKSKEEQDLEKKKEMLNSSVLSLVMSVSSLAEGKVSFMDYMKDLFDPVLLLDVRFILLALSGFFTSASMITTYTFIVDYAVNVGIDHNSAAFLISIIGITNTAGRVILGMASDCKNISALWLNNVALLLGGVGVICWPYYNTHLWFLLMAGIFGASIAAFAALRSVITVELLGLEKLNNAFGLQIMCQGIAGVVGPPLAGFLFGMTKTYDLPFRVSGLLMVLSGLLCVPLACLKKPPQTSEKQTQPVVETA